MTPFLSGHGLFKIHIILKRRNLNLHSIFFPIIDESIFYYKIFIIMLWKFLNIPMTPF